MKTVIFLAIVWLMTQPAAAGFKEDLVTAEALCQSGDSALSVLGREWLQRIEKDYSPSAEYVETINTLKKKCAKQLINPINPKPTNGVFANPSVLGKDAAGLAIEPVPPMKPEPGFQR